MNYVNIFSVYFVAMASYQALSADYHKTSNKLLYTDLVQQGEGENTRYLFCCNEIDDLKRHYGEGARLPNQQEAEEVCKALDDINLAEVYERSDFEMVYQDFFIASDDPLKPRVFCPTSNNQKTRELGRDDKCCVRFVVGSQSSSLREHNTGWHKIIRSSADVVWSKCTLHNAYNIGGTAFMCYSIYKCIANPVSEMPPGPARIVKEKVMLVIYFACGKIADMVRQKALLAPDNGCL